MKTEFDLSSYQNIKSMGKGLELIDHINKPMFSSPDTGITARSINHWEEIGIIDNNRGKDQRNRKFSFVEYCWIKIVQQLREIGVSTQTIKSLKEELFEPFGPADLWEPLVSMPGAIEAVLNNVAEDERGGLEEWIKRKGWLEVEDESRLITGLVLLLSDAVVQRKPISIAVFLDGTYVPIVEGVPLPNPHHNDLIWRTHVRVSFTQILKEFLNGDLAEKRVSDLHLLNPIESQILEMIHSGEYKSVKINFKDQKIASLDLVKSQLATKRIVDVLAESQYQNISITTHKGMVTKIENTIKIKL